MLGSRLSLALEDGALSLPEDGRIALFSPPKGTDVSDLPQDRLDVISRHFPVFSDFETKGYITSVAAKGPYALTILCLPRAKAEARAAMAEAVQVTEGPIWVDGQKTDGVESMLKGLRSMGDLGPVIVKAHGKLFEITNADCTGLEARPSQIARPGGATFQTAPGVFSADRIDPGSEALAISLPDDMKGHVIDLGAGWGYLTDAVLTRPKITRVDLVEADHAALEAARTNVTDPRAAFHWTDALSFKPEDRADHVITNPPFHTSRAADPGLGQAFIQAAARLLKPKGQLWLVANRHLPYERTLDGAFRTVETLAQTSGYKITHASGPRTSRKG